jgi:hypothetical protein
MRVIFLILKPKRLNAVLSCAGLLFALLLPGSLAAPRIVEELNRGVVAVDTGSGIYVGWRLLGTDPETVSFNVYRNGMLLNLPMTYATGRTGRAIDLNGSGDAIVLPTGIFNVSDISVAAWVFWDGGNAWQRIFDFGNDTTQYMFLTPMSASNTLRFGIRNRDSEQIVETSALATGQWVHLAVTLSGNRAVLYVNGAAVATNNVISINPSDFNPTHNYVGRSQWPDPLFNGRIDGFRVYGSALTDTEIADLANLSPPGATPIIHYEFEGDTLDSSGNAHHATASGGPITGSTNYLDSAGATNSTYYVRAIVDSVERAPSEVAPVWANFYQDIPLRPMAGYTANDGSIGDLDGDGDLEIVLKRLSGDVSGTSTDFNLIEAYHMDGTFMWAIDLGPNNLYAGMEINPIVFDFDSDGRAEVALRTCEGNIDGTGVRIDDTDGDGKTDYRDSAVVNTTLWMTEGPEFLSIFDGETGAELARADYIARDPISQWGEWGMNLSQYAHRADKCMMTPAYLDGQRPSLVICRGIYHRTKLEAWNFRNNTLVKLWSFDSEHWPGYGGQGNHNLTVGDVDSDGRDEIVYASMCIDDDGAGLYTTELGHGDALHMSDMIPTRPGLEVFQCHEHFPYGTTLRDAGTGEILWRQTADGDTGRSCAAHIDARYPGYQMWSVHSGGTFNAADNSRISASTPNWGNFLIWWDADLQREILDGVGSNPLPIINKWYGEDAGRLISLYDFPSPYSTKCINGTKANPCLSGDILGDWREEVIFPASDDTALRIFTTTSLASHRIPSLLHDSQYRLAMAWQCNMYNQPPHPSIYIGAGMTLPVPMPDIIYPTDLVGDTTPPQAPRGLTVLPWDGEVVLNWDDNDEADLSGYIVRCTLESGAAYSVIANGLIDSQYTDHTVSNGVTYHYVVSAIDVNANESDNSEEVSATPQAGGFPALLVHYEFEENTLDSSGYGNDAVASGSPGYTSGRSGQAVNLDGTNDVLTAPAGIANSDDITVAAWVYWNGGDSWQRIFDFGNNTSQHMFLIPSANDSTMRFTINSGSGEQTVHSDPLPIETWTHVAVSLDGDLASLYVNGESVSTNVACTINPSDFEPQTNYIGDSQFAADPLFSGAIDDFRVYSYALTPHEVAMLADERVYHSADHNRDVTIDLNELLRVIQLYQGGVFSCAVPPEATEDGYAAEGGSTECPPHDSDYAPQDWRVDLTELLRTVQLYSAGSYYACPGNSAEDDFCLRSSASE